MDEQGKAIPPIIDAETVRRINEGLAKAVKDAAGVFVEATRVMRLQHALGLALRNEMGRLDEMVDALSAADLRDLGHATSRVIGAIRRTEARRH